MSELKTRERELALPPPFCSIWVLKGLGDAPHHWRVWTSLLSLLIQMLISLTDTSRNNLLPVIRASLSPVKLIHESNHHTT